MTIHLPMQGTQVRSLIWEDPTCQGAAEPVSYNCLACALESGVPQLLSLQLESSPCPLLLEKSPLESNKDPAQPKINECKSRIEQNKILVMLVV